MIESEFIVGNKRVAVHLIGDIAGAWVQSDQNLTKCPGDTTDSFRKVSAFLAEQACILGHDLTFQFVTIQHILRKWALDPTKGASIFQWQVISNRDLPNGLVDFSAQAIIHCSRRLY